jgi:hypothetical protein
MIAVMLVLSLSVAGIILAQWRSSYRALHPLALLPTPTPPQLSKEYIYAGGRLIATEEPGAATSPLSAPSGLTATGVSGPPASVTLTWTASTGGTVDHYRVEKCQSFGPNCYSFAADVPAATGTVTYTDSNGVSAGAAYLYKVRAVDASGLYTNYSNADMVTALTFTDDPLNPQGTKTVIKAAHLNELRQAVNAVRALVGLPAASWTYPDPVSNPPSQRRKIYLEDVTELRSNLDAALNVLGMTQPYPSDPPLDRGAVVRAAHFTQIRDRVK